MSLLKDKPLKKCHTDNRKMIDDIHVEIIKDMNKRNSTSNKRREKNSNKSTRKRREELSICASKSIKKEKIEIVVNFN